MSEPIIVDDEGEREGEELAMSRKEKRRELKKKRRREKRQEVAAKEREDEEARLNDPEELKRMLLMEEEERERLEKERLEFEERERIWREKRKKEEVEEEERLRMMVANVPEDTDIEKVNENGEGIDWEYEDCPAEIIWQGNEIIVKKKKIRVPKKNMDHHTRDEDADRPTSNPLPPQSEAFEDYSNASNNVYDIVAQQVPNFGTEQDKSHCPFHIKTGACRFTPCRRLHLYPDRACTILIKNMYNGPGLASAWERDEGLEYTDEEAERCYEEFYEDVHTEFLKFGEIVNFKVCRNGSFHLRGNVYVHYKSLDSAMLAYQEINGRFFALKQLTCEYVGVTKWRIAICGEYMKSKLKTCSRGTECNFIHCFRNPGGDYEWADWDKPPPRYWVEKMSALFGYSDESLRSNSHMRTAESDRHRSRRSRSRDRDRLSNGSGRCHSVRSDPQKRNEDRKRNKVMDGKKYEDRTYFIEYHPYSERESLDTDTDTDCDRYLSDRDREVEEERDRYHGHAKKSSRRSNKILEFPDDYRDDSIRTCEVDSDKDKERQKHHSRTRKRSKHRNKASRSPENHGHRRKWTDDNESAGILSDRNREGHKSHRHQKISEFSVEDNKKNISEDGMRTENSTRRERRESQDNKKRIHDDTDSGENRSDRERDGKKHGSLKKMEVQAQGSERRSRIIGQTRKEQDAMLETLKNSVDISHKGF